MNIQGYHLPEDLYYEKNHYWVKVDGNILLMGMDDFAQQMAGDIVFVQIPFAGKKLKSGKKFAQVESGKWLGKVYAPVTGELIEGNAALEVEPTLINQDCYAAGWMYKIKPTDMDELKNLIHDPADIEKWLLEDIEKYKQD